MVRLHNSMKKESKNVTLEFKILKRVSNPNSIHGIYPYRGKISAIDAKNLIEQLPNKGVLLEAKLIVPKVKGKRKVCVKAVDVFGFESVAVEEVK